MKETKTAKGGSECPTLLHYIARVLLRTDPSLVAFIGDVPHLEAAARGIYTLPLILRGCTYKFLSVSMQLIMQSVNSLVAGLQQVDGEIRQLRQSRTSPVDDQFIHVMQVFDVFICILRHVLMFLCHYSHS
jgi:hypothetical protein